jgi:hypothetical protein
MRTTLRTLTLLVGTAILPSTAWAQATLAGTVKDNSGGVLPGVTVEASSPVLIEKARTATTDATGQYRIESLQPGTYAVTFTLSGFSVLKRTDVAVSGTGVIKIDAELKVGGVSETVTVTGETPVVDVQSTKREITLDNETVRNMPGVRSYSGLLALAPGVQSNLGNIGTGPVFAIFPIHGGRGVESRLTVDGLNISNPPGGNQPPNFTADIGNASEVTMTMSGGLGEFETAGLTMNIVPKQGGNTLSGLFYVSGFSKGMQADNFTDELKTRASIPGTNATTTTQPTPVYHVYDVNGALGGPIMKDQLWYYMSVRAQGQRRDTLNVYYNLNAGNPSAFAYAPDLTKPAYSDRLWENYTPRITYQATPRNKFSFAWDEQPVCRTCSGTTSLTGSPNFIFPTSPEADGHGEFSPQRVVQGHWTSPVTSKLLLEAGVGTTYYQWGGRELDPNPTENLVRVTDLAAPITSTLTTAMVYRSQNWLVNKTSGTTWMFTGTYVTGAHSLKFGYQGNLWKDDREMHTNTQNLAYTFFAGKPVFPFGNITEYANPYIVNASARQDSLFAQDQWTVRRLTVQGALRWDHPWSWFPAQTEPASRFFPGATFPRTDGVTGYNDITPRMGASYDLFGNGKTGLKFSVGKYLQGASVSNLAYGANPALRIPGGNASGFLNPSVSRLWNDTNGNFVPDCNLDNPLTNGECGQINILNFGSNQLVGAVYDPDLLHGWNIRPSDWSYGASVQQQIFPNASVEVGYYRRTFTQYTTGGTVTDNLSVSPANLGAWNLTAPKDARLPGGGGNIIGPLYNIDPAVFGQSNLLIESTKKVGDDTRVFNGVDATVTIRRIRNFTLSASTSTGKVVNDWCAIRAAVPEGTYAGVTGLLNPYCHTESPIQTSFRVLMTYTIPRIDVLVSTVYQDKPNVGTDQLVGIPANYTLAAADLASAQVQIGRPLSPYAVPNNAVNLVAPGDLYGDRIRQWDLSVKKIIRLGGQRLTVGLDMYNLMNNNVTLAFTPTFVPNVSGWSAPTMYMNPTIFRLNAEFAF